MDRLREIEELILSSAHIIYVQRYDEKIKENAARNDMIFMLKKIERLRKALEGVKRGDCWCEMAVGNPMVKEHSKACLKTQQALKEG